MGETIMNLQPELENDLVRIIPLHASDFERLFQVASDPLIWEQHPTKNRYEKAVFTLYFDSAVASGSAFLLLEKSTNELMGSTRFYDYKQELSSIAIGYTFLAKKYWGGEFNRSVKELLLAYAFEFVDSVLFHVGPMNIRSQKALLKIGATKIREVILDFSPEMHVEFQIRKEDWLKRKRASHGALGPDAPAI